MTMRCRLLVSYNGKKHNYPKLNTIFYLTCDHFRDMTQSISALKLVFSCKMTHAKYANDVVHLVHNIERQKSCPL